MHADILIIGAGPAGCAAAIHARQAGLSVMMIDARADACRAPGETLHPGVEPILKKLGVWHDVIAAGFHRHRGVWRESGSLRVFESYGSDSGLGSDSGPDSGGRQAWLGFQANRRTLHGILQRAAEQAGVVLRRNAAPDGVIREDGCRGGVGGVVCKRAEIRTRWVFDATGRRAWLARMLALRAERSGPPLRVRFGWKDGEDPCLEGQPLFQQQLNGWAWQAPLGDGSTAWASLEQASARTVQPGWGEDGGGKGKGGRGVDMTWRLHAPCAGPGYFLLGDAAALLDPASSNGVLRALMSGMLAADLAAQVRCGRDERAAAQAYSSWISGLFHHQAARLLDSYLPVRNTGERAG
ncbi:MAG: FAD-dependent monooxygenase [Nitrosospira sp.]